MLIETLDPVSLDEALAQYHGEWVLMEVTAFDHHKAPSHGVVIAHEISHKRVCRILEKVARSNQDTPDICYYLFSAYPRVSTGDEMRKVLAEAKKAL